MAVALVIGKDEQERRKFSSYIQEWKIALLAQAPNLDIRIYPELGDINEIEFLLVFSVPDDFFKGFPHVKAVLALSAGIDDILANPSLFSDIPIVRIMDPFMASDICQYAVTYVLNHVKRVDHWKNLQQQHKWGKEPPYDFSKKTIGVMGLGFLGEKVARALSQLDFSVNGWSQSSKEIPQVRVYTSKKEFDDFLANTDILICLLPLTANTRHILNKDTFAKLKKNAYLINIGRGEHLVEEDLLVALDSGQLSGATLDVFQKEPLAAAHVFWDHPKIVVTPHIASITNPATASIVVVENIKRIQQDELPVGSVNLMKGY
jgi:glyoxylate/hydroxypyruvate reductase A